ncbi:hypothetical protein EX30DRAFT_319800 [Ascodesmis nigricans]|uniref:Maintenance of telomere capping protein 1 n=1 Tax=Ascodesmis nigricans TaxID=341454 RepID=A0A4S2MVI2_9PEZI|nr:hypothetical protein EX30DRAFT_319800 [Ascodesmis nigricans]
MAKSQNPDDLLNELDALVDSAAPKKAPKAKKDPSLAQTQDEYDILADLESLAERPKPNLSRPSTPRAASVPKKSMERSRTPGGGYGIPITGSTRASMEEKQPAVKPTTPLATEVKREPEPAPEPPQEAEQSSGGGWGWGSLWSTATAAVKTAEAVVKEVQKSEEVNKWASQVRGNADILKGLAGDVRSKALPTFTNLLHHLAPPISSHEQLRIHITHDLQNYPFVETVVYGVFDRVMQQVEGGDLMVVQRGSGSKPRSAVDVPFAGGPWWKAMEKREHNATDGLQEGVKLAKAAAVSYAADFSKTDPVTTTPENPQNPTRKSNIFLALQPTIHAPFDGSEEDEKVVSFAIHLYDPENSLNFSTLSQSVPLQWFEWLDAAPPAVEAGEWALPEVIQDIIDAGGVDPREWVVEWVEEAVGLAVGVVAQKYVAKRMRVGEASEMARVVRNAEQESLVNEEARVMAM